MKYLDLITNKRAKLQAALYEFTLINDTSFKAMFSCENQEEREIHIQSWKKSLEVIRRVEQNISCLTTLINNERILIKQFNDLKNITESIDL